MKVNIMNIELIKNYINQQLPLTCSLLHISEVGSFMWNMGNESDEDIGISDHDIFVVYQYSTGKLLMGCNYKNNLPNKHNIILGDKHYDFSFMEIGHLINLLIKGNINAIWCLTSPLNYYTKLNRLIELVTNSIYLLDLLPSGLGLIRSNIIDSEKRKEVRNPQKSLNAAYRTLKFLENIYFNNKTSYEPVENVTIDQINELMNKIELYNTINIKPTEDLKFQVEWHLRNNLYRLRLLNITPDQQNYIEGLWLNEKINPNEL